MAGHTPAVGGPARRPRVRPAPAARVRPAPRGPRCASPAPGARKAPPRPALPAGRDSSPGRQASGEADRSPATRSMNIHEKSAGCGRAHCVWSEPGTLPFTFRGGLGLGTGRRVSEFVLWANPSRSSDLRPQRGRPRRGQALSGSSSDPPSARGWGVGRSVFAAPKTTRPPKTECSAVAPG